METSPTPSPARILLAEDDEMIRRSLVFALTRSGYSVQAHPDGLAAWSAFLDAGPWDLLLTDLEMPGMDGAELTRLIRCRHPSFPLIVLTGHEEGPLQAREILPENVLILAKPYRFETLLQAIAGSISSAPARDLPRPDGSN